MKFQRGIYCKYFKFIHAFLYRLLMCLLFRAAYGFEKPSPIQQRAIMPIIAKRDVLAQAQSGTGKTGTFSIGILERIDVTKPHCQVRRHRC